MRNKDEFKVAFLNRFFRSHNVLLEPYTLHAATIFADLRGQYRVAGVDLFVTNDTALTRLTIPGIGSVIGLDVSF